MSAEPKKKDKIVRVRVNKNLLRLLQKQAISTQVSLDGYINLTLTSALQKPAVIFEEKINKNSCFPDGK